MPARCVAQTRWEEHTKPTWQRWDLACPRVKKNRHNTITEPNIVKTGSCLLEGSTFVREMRGAKKVGGTN